MSGYQLSEDQVMIVDAARAFADEALKPNAARWEEEKTLDKATLKEMAALGCVSTAAFVSIHNMSAWMVDSFGDEAQRRKWLPKITSMELITSYCLTEPGAGSDAGGLRTSAKRDGDSYILNGTKTFISGGGFSDLYLVMARTGEPGAKGVSTFLIENGTPGLSFGKNEKKMGWQAQPTAQVIMEECRVPAENRIGPEGEGFKYAMKGLDGGRLNISACSLGGASEALDRSIAYAKDRKQFGKAIADFQATQFKLADMAIELEAGRALLYEAARRLDAKDADATKYCAMAKRYVTDACFKVANDALQIHGGYGYLSEYEIERMVRDLRVHQILEGTNEIMRVIVARELLK